MIAPRQDSPLAVKTVFPRTLKTQHLFFKRKIQLMEPFVVQSETIGRFIVPLGFISDGASVPRWFWSIFPPFGKYLEAAVAHDYIYAEAYHKFTKEQADTLFLELLKLLDIGFIKRNTMYTAVKFGGTGGWD